MRLQGLGYELERGKHGQPEIKGYTKEYLEASSPRREQIKDHLREMGIDGAGAAQVAAHRTRDSKELLSPGEVLERHRELAAQYGHQADKVVAEARAHEQRHVYEPDRIAQQAVTYIHLEYEQLPAIVKDVGVWRNFWRSWRRGGDIESLQNRR